MLISRTWSKHLLTILHHSLRLNVQSLSHSTYPFLSDPPSSVASCASHACNSAWVVESLQFPVLKLKGLGKLKSREMKERAASIEIIESQFDFFGHFDKTGNAL